MPITYAGIGLTPPNDAQDIVDQFWHVHRILEFTFPSGTVLPSVDRVPIPSPDQQEPPRIGVLRWPNGASRWATCYLVATGEQLADIRTAIGSSASAKTLILDDNLEQITTSMWLLPPRPILQKGSNEYYLITLVDQRWWWYQKGNQIVPQNPTTWSGFLTSLFTAVGASATIDSIPSGYGTPNTDRWDLGYKPIPVIIDAVCSTVGLQLVRKLDGTLRCYNYTNAAAEDVSNWTTYQTKVLTGGQLAVSDIALSVPASVAVVFGGSSPSVTTKTLASLALSSYSGATGVSSMVGQIIADMLGTAGATARSNYATQAATDYYQWALSRTDCSMRGLQPREITGLDDVQEWVLTSQAALTRVIRPPFSDRNIYGENGENGSCGSAGSSPDDCGECFPCEDSDPIDTDSDPIAVVDTECILGTLWVMRAKQRIVWSDSVHRPLIQQYDFTITSEGCCSCNGGSGSGSGSDSTLCFDHFIPTSLCVTFTGATGTMAALAGVVVTLTYIPTSGFWVGCTPTCNPSCPYLGVTLHCGARGEASPGQILIGFRGFTTDCPPQNLAIVPSWVATVSSWSPFAATISESGTAVVDTGNCAWCEAACVDGAWTFDLAVSESPCGSGSCGSGSGSGSTPGCCYFPNTIYACFSGVAIGPLTMTWYPSANMWISGSVSICGVICKLTLSCAGGVWTAKRVGPGGDRYLKNFVYSSSACSPFSVVFDADYVCGGITPVTITFSEYVGCVAPGCNGGTAYTPTDCTTAPPAVSLSVKYDWLKGAGTEYIGPFAVTPGTTYNIDNSGTTGTGDVIGSTTNTCLGLAANIGSIGVPGGTTTFPSGVYSWVYLRVTAGTVGQCVSLKVYP